MTTFTDPCVTEEDTSIQLAEVKTPPHVFL